MGGFEFFSVVLTVCVVCVLVECKYISYNTSGGIVSGKLNVHLVPHSHDDVGWLKTIDQYYVGSNNSIHAACVRNILNSLIPALLDDQNRKFIFVEQAYFQRWWNEQSEAKKKIVKLLVRSGQLEFVNGGMCMHDEATTYYIDMIDQTTLGHRFIKQEFNVTPSIGWQVDPFGHSAVQAYLLAAEVGFDAQYFGRIHYQDIAKRRDEKTLEVIWRGSKSRGSSSQIFAGTFYTGFYEPPHGFYFEINFGSPIVQDDIELSDYNVEDRVNDFVAAAYKQANVTRSNHIMFTMGTDFMYQYANTWFENMDKLIHYVNQDGRVNTFYSTPSLYTKAKNVLDESWPVKSDDYFPYADKLNTYWTGYYSSRAGFKGYIRVLSGYYLAARQLEFFRGRNKKGPTTDSLGDALAIAQHHDGITGTQKQHVANDFSKRLSSGYDESEDVVAASFDCITRSSLSSKCKSVLTNFSQCPLLNISYCPATEVDLSFGKKIAVLVYNPLGWKRSDVVKIPVTNENVTVKDSTGNSILSQLIPITNPSASMGEFYATAYTGESPSNGPKYWLAFTAVVPPLGFSTYVISTGQSLALIKPTTYTFDRSQTEDIQVGSGNLKLVYSGNDGKLTRYINVRNSVNVSVEQSYSYYAGKVWSLHDPQASGAYIFRPNGTFPIAPEGNISLTVFRGPLFDEVHQKINPWIYQITRVYKEKEHVEVEFSIGPVAIDDGIGKDIVAQIKTEIGNNGTFYTDSNGRDFQERIRDHKAHFDLQVDQPIAGNYYPISFGMYIKDKKTELSVLVDRSVGGSSLFDGQVEIMLHRRLLHDDGKGVEEALDETICVDDTCSGLIVQGKYYLRFDPLGDGSKWRRSFGQAIYSPFLFAFSDKDDKWTNFPISTFSAMDPSYTIPDNVAIITLQELQDESVLLRMAHLYEVGEDKELSMMANVELKKMFSNKKINKIKEMSLSANQEREEMERKRLSWKIDGSGTKPDPDSRGGPMHPIKLVVQLGPMEIRTFIIQFDPIGAPNKRRRKATIIMPNNITIISN